MPDIDSKIIEGCQKGDMPSFEKLYLTYQHSIYNLAYRMCGEHNEAEDLSSDIFLALLIKIKKFKFRSHFSAWFYKLATNLCLDRIRRKKKFSFQSLDEVKEQTLTQQGFPCDFDPAKEDLERSVQSALNSLPQKQRMCIILRDVEGFSYRRISEILGISEGTVRSRLSRARERMRRELASKK